MDPHHSSPIRKPPLHNRSRNLRPLPEADEIIKILKDNGKNIIEDPGVMPNPTIEKLREGIKIARDNKTDLLLAVGGGSCCDYAKAVSVSVNCDEDPWDKYYIRGNAQVFNP